MCIPCSIVDSDEIWMKLTCTSAKTGDNIVILLETVLYIIELNTKINLTIFDSLLLAT